MPKRTNPNTADELLALAMAQGESIADWAGRSGTNLRAAYRMAVKPEVRARASTLRGEMIDAAVGRLAESATEADATLRGLLGEDVADATRLQAAKAILSALVDVQVHAELGRRIEELELKISEKNVSDQKGVCK